MPTPTLAAHGPSAISLHAPSAPVLVPTVPIRLKPLPLPDWLDEPATADALMLLTDDGTDLTSHLAALLAARGLTVAVLVLPATHSGDGAQLPPGVERISLPDHPPAFADQQLARVVADLAARHHSIAGFVHLSPPAGPGVAGELFAARDDAMVRQVFLLARHLHQPLTARAATTRVRFAAVTRLDGQLGHSGEGSASPVSGGLYGLVKSLNAEWPAVWCRAIDLAPTIGPNEAAQIILAELHDPSRLVTEVGYGPGGRVTLAGA